MDLITYQGERFEDSGRNWRRERERREDRKKAYLKKDQSCKIIEMSPLPFTQRTLISKLMKTFPKGALVIHSSETQLKVIFHNRALNI